MKKISLLLFLVSYLAIGQKTITKDSIDLKLEKIISDHNLPGLNFSTVLKDGSIRNYSVGKADIEDGLALSTSNTFFSGSIGKTYAVAIIMPLIENGKIELKATLKSYFPKLDWLKRIPNYNEITVEMLLQHTSGLPRYIMNMEVWKTLHDEPDKIWTYKDRLSYIFDLAPVNAPGEGWAYSDTNYLLLGMLIEYITGDKYYDLVKTQIIDKFKLMNTHPSLSRTIPNLAVGYSKMPPPFMIPNKTVDKGVYIFNPQFEWTGGGMASTTEDLAKWAKLYFEGKLFSEKSLKLITSVNPKGNKVMGPGSYGMGSFIYETNLGPAYGHSGFMPGYNALFMYYPKYGIAAAIQVNCDYATAVVNSNIVINKLVRSLINE